MDEDIEGDFGPADIIGDQDRPERRCI